MGGDVHPLWRSVNHLVVNIFIGILDGQKPFFRCGVHFLSIFIRQHSPCAIVKLHIPAACIVQLMQYSNVSLCNVVHQRLGRTVKGLCVFSGKGHPELCQRLSRGGDCLFCYSLFVLQRLHIPKMIHKGMLTGQSDPAGHKSIIDHRRLSVEGKAGVRFLMADAVESPHKIQMPGSAAELAVSNNMVSGRFLLRHQFGNALILHSFELIGGNGSCFIIGAGLFQFCRTKKAAHVVVTERCV